MKGKVSSEKYDKLLKSFYDELDKMNNDFSKLKKSKARKNDRLHLFRLYLVWMKALNYYEDINKFTGCSKSSFKDSEMTTNYQFFINYNPYVKLNLTWIFRFTNKVIHRLKSLISETYIDSFMKVVFTLAQGDFTQARLHMIGPVLFMACFQQNILWNEILAYCILPERVPSVIKGNVHSYTYSQHIRFIDVVHHIGNLNNVFDNFFKSIANHPDKFLSFEYAEYFSSSDFLHHDNVRNYNKGDLNNVVLNSVSARIDNGRIHYTPKIRGEFTPLKAYSATITYDYDRKCWVPPNMKEIKYPGSVANYMERAITVIFLDIRNREKRIRKH
jgi:hypothetical protein